MRARFALLGITALAVVVTVGWSPAAGQFGGLKNKIKQKAADKADEKTDEALDAATSGEDQAAPDSAAPRATEPGKAESGTAEDMSLYVKYDFVPGDKVLFYDDLAGEEVGEFPSRWNLDHGVFEVVRRGDRNYIMCTDEGILFPRIAPGPLPPRYTVEMDFVAKGKDARGHWFFIEWVNSDNERIGEFAMTDGHATAVTILDQKLANKQLPDELAPGVHTMRVMATKSTLKCYVDHERVANVPAVEGFEPAGLRVHMDPWADETDNPMLMAGFRFAEGGKTLKDQLDEAGRIITHGIRFDSGSAKIQAESYKTLANIGQLLADSPGLRLSIEGHTDSDGNDAANLTLSQERAAAVRAWLVESVNVDPTRLETKGWGESKPIDTNNTPEGKATNRRVELVKL